uniref:tetrahydrofolate synthase n=1 Tax=Meloidogyne hapla TaxID=6305 RepID=A0A1I8BCB9_MELHA
MTILGTTIPEIAWHKAGIAKPNCTLLTVEQPPEAIEIIKQRCKERNSKFFIVPSTINSYQWPNSNIKFGISGYHQHSNVSLALQLARIFCLNSASHKNGNLIPFLNQNSSKETTKINNILNGFEVNENIYKALFNCKWLGRSQILKKKNIYYFLDGAHTPLSIKYCAQWFKENSFNNNNNIQRLLIFHCTGYRDSSQLLPVFKDFNFNAALFCPAIIEENNSLINDSINLNHDSSKELKRCFKDKQLWMELFENKIENNNSKSNQIPTKPNAQCFSCISQTLEWITKYSLNMSKGNELHVLITGSLHLVGDTLAILERSLNELEELK